MVVIGQPLPRRRERHPYNVLVVALLGVIALLIVANLVLLLIRALDRPGKPAAGALIYATDFAAENASNAEWTQESGQSSSAIDGGALLITIDDINSLFSVLKRDFTDTDVRANITLTGATSDYDEYGLLYRFRDASHYYMFKLRSDGAYRVEAVNQDEAGRTDVNVLSEWQISTAVRIGLKATNQLRVIASGDTFEFYVNGALLPLCPKGTDRRSTWNDLTSGRCLSNGGQTSITLRDTTFTEGRIGVGAVADSVGLRVAFDNVVVYGPN